MPPSLRALLPVTGEPSEEEGLAGCLSDYDLERQGEVEGGGGGGRWWQAPIECHNQMPGAPY